MSWVRSRVEVLEQRSLQCFKCFVNGHVRSRYPNSTDCSDRCYRCETLGHVALVCTQPDAQCSWCEDLGRLLNHRIGGKACPFLRRKKGAGQKLATKLTATEAGVTYQAKTPSSKTTAAVPAAERTHLLKAAEKGKTILLPPTSPSSSEGVTFSALLV